MIRSDYHCHTLYCDGADSPLEMIRSAIKNNMDSLGFSGHSYTAFDSSWCMTLNDTRNYIKEINRLKEEYKDELTVLCGVEQDYYSKEDTEAFDYVIGSVHYILSDHIYIPVDETEEILTEAADTFFDGDIYKLTESYYETVSDLYRKTNCDIIGHFDLITKFNEGMTLFDESHPSYIKAYRKAIDSLIPFNKPFEVNMGAMIRGYRSHPYPNPDVMKYIHDQGGSFILNSDSHGKDSLCYQFDLWEEKLKALGYRITDWTKPLI